jgi:hypothetical protein
VLDCPNVNDNWLVNYTDVAIPTEMQVLLSYGEKFSVYEGVEKINYYHLIADVENVISRTIEDESLRNVARTDVAGIIKDYVSHGGSTQTPADKLFRDVTLRSMKFIKDYHQDDSAKEFYIARSDKCNQTVILYKDDYLSGMRKLVDDRTSYVLTDRDITTEACNAVRSLAKVMQERGYIDRTGFLNLVINNAYAPRIYGLVKTHKADVNRHNLKLRPVVSYIGSPLYNLSKYVGKIIRNSIKSKFNVKNSYEFNEFIRSKSVPPGYVLVSMDVTSLFTCLPQNFLVECVKRKWNEISKHTNMSKEMFIKAVEVCLNYSYFVFQGRLYLQISGTPMGGPASSPLCDLAMEVILEMVMDLLPFDVPFIIKYVDDGKKPFCLVFS